MQKIIREMIMKQSKTLFYICIVITCVLCGGAQTEDIVSVFSDKTYRDNIIELSNADFKSLDELVKKVDEAASDEEKAALYRSVIKGYKIHIEGFNDTNIKKCL